MRIAGLALVSIAVLSLACASVRVRTDYDDAIDFSKLKSFAWLDPPLREASRDEGGQGGDPFTQNTLLDKRVRDEVEGWLLSHGYRLAGEREEPDFLLRYEFTSREVYRDSPVTVSGGFGSYGSGVGIGSGVGYSPSGGSQEGTLILDVIDPATEQLSWRGWGTTQLRDSHIGPERIRETVGAVLERFPPKPKRGGRSGD